jgi:sodium-dependent phosphate cotransporter
MDSEEEVTDINSRKNRPTGSAHVGDVDFFEENVEDIGDASWHEVMQTCCCHSPLEWGYIFIGICLLCFFLYFFLLGLDLLGSSAKVVGGCTAGTLLGDDTNPIAALMIGILATVLIQSSSTTTSIVVSLVGSGSIPTRQAIYMIMGANIGTSVTNTIVAMGQMGDGDQLERAFAGATVHDMFNFMSVGILLPIEVATGYLYHLTKAMVSNVTLQDGEKWEGPIKKLVGPLGAKIIIANKNVIKDVAKGGSCEDYYPVRCQDASNPTKSTCNYGLIGCDKTSGDCPAFFQSTAEQKDDEVSGGVCFFLALIILIFCLVGLVTILQKLLLGMSTRIIYKATNINGYLAMLVGTGITILVQSSSITTSTLTPLVGMGVLQLEQMFPLTLGANIGTTVTAILASLVADTIDALQVALAHLFFNISGILIFYPVPFMRRLPINAARKLGKATRIWRGFPILYIAIMFFIIPICLLSMSTLFEQGAVGYTVLGTLLVLFIVLLLIWMFYKWRYQGGREDCLNCLEARQRTRMASHNLADDMEYVKLKVAALSEHTGLSWDEADDDQDVEEGKDLIAIEHDIDMEDIEEVAA